MGPRAGLDGCGKSRLLHIGIRSPDRPARSESLYRLSYRGRHIRLVAEHKALHLNLYRFATFKSFWFTIKYFEFVEETSKVSFHPVRRIMAKGTQINEEIGK